MLDHGNKIQRLFEVLNHKNSSTFHEENVRYSSMFMKFINSFTAEHQTKLITHENVIKIPSQLETISFLFLNLLMQSLQYVR